MSFHQALEDSTRNLTASERKIGSILLADSRSAPFMRIAELAKKAGVHESTVVRFAQKLGYAGFIDMREALVADSLSTMDRTIAMREEGEKYSLAMVISSQVQVLQSLPEKISQERLDVVVQHMLSARRVHILGSGLVLPLVEFMRAKLVSSGLHVDTITHSGHERSQRLAQIQPDDALVVFAFSEDYTSIADQIRLVAKRGTEVILLTDEQTLMNAGLPETVIAIPRDQARHGVIVSMTALCYAIHYDLLQYRNEEWRAVRDRVAEFDNL
ncbi:MurR/RpiR family transcriptional regulator [Nocardioides cavernae]|uniref:MurR/RpiR family transcriptional regulator n=1 Tax=Nocardioides cavernae TaxID=1921566 RepID=A0ABR8N9H3_9ACTN|nr:MurR/RpiR family transcriptional regulator [Nocardioides cavernae]MBD3924241.1 MurR/RpiR family transcriptional regulator [Nocardioides cavernae]MBM7510820.1 DNA-binding MurR/RpiR family transcriptional regulator [Nocardioides cavernae]